MIKMSKNRITGVSIGLNSYQWKPNITEVTFFRKDGNRYIHHEYLFKSLDERRIKKLYKLADESYVFIHPKSILIQVYYNSRLEKFLDKLPGYSLTLAFYILFFLWLIK
jgi:hypothetical protein